MIPPPMSPNPFAPAAPPQEYGGWFFADRKLDEVTPVIESPKDRARGLRIMREIVFETPKRFDETVLPLREDHQDLYARVGLHLDRCLFAHDGHRDAVETNGVYCAANEYTTQLIARRWREWRTQS